MSAAGNLPPPPLVTPGVRRTAWMFVAVQFILLGLIVLLPDGETWPASPGRTLIGTLGTWVGPAVMVAAGLGLGRGLTAAPLPNEHARLRTGGLYRLVRHPIYSGLLLFTLAQVIASGSAVVAVAGLLLVVLINVKARWEERRLAERFGDYCRYAERTARFVPGLRLRSRRSPDRPRRT